MPWLSLLSLALKLAGLLASWARERELLAAGERRAVAAQLALIARRLEIVHEIEGEVALMTEEALDAALEADAWPEEDETR